LNDTLYYYKESDNAELNSIKAFTNDIGDFYLVDYDYISIYEIFIDAYFGDLFIEVRQTQIYFYFRLLRRGNHSWKGFVLGVYFNS
jgi:hypothetical protein